MSFIQQVSWIFKQGIKVELADKERIFSPLLFGATLLILFSIAGESSAQTVDLFIGQVFLILLFCLQVVFSRTFEADQQDRILELMRTMPLSAEAWFFGKYFLVCVLGAAVCFPTVLLTGLFQSTSGTELIQPFLFLVLGMALANLAAIGVLLASMTLSASGKQILFPLLYFPLAVPVFLVGSQAASAFFQSPNEIPWQWLGAMSGMGVIYITLAVLLYDEVIRA